MYNSVYFVYSIQLVATEYECIVLHLNIEIFPGMLDSPIVFLINYDPYNVAKG